MLYIHVFKPCSNKYSIQPVINLAEYSLLSTN